MTTNEGKFKAVVYPGYGYAVLDNKTGKYVREKGVILIRITQEAVDKLVERLERKAAQEVYVKPERSPDPSKPDHDAVDVKDMPKKIVCHNCGVELTDIFGSDEIHLSKDVNGWHLEEDPTELNCSKCLNPLDTRRPEVQEIMKAVGLL